MIFVDFSHFPQIFSTQFPERLEEQDSSCEQEPRVPGQPYSVHELDCGGATIQTEAVQREGELG